MCSRRFVLFLVAVFLCPEVSSDANLSFGNATPGSPSMRLNAAVDEFGRLRQTIVWTFQASQCEVLTRTDESITSRAVVVSITSSCVNRNVCNARGPIPTPIVCEEFMRRLN